MSENREKRYCVVDHADKLGEREARNPNRLKLLRERRGKWVDATGGASDSRGKDGGR